MKRIFIFLKRPPPGIFNCMPVVPEKNRKMCGEADWIKENCPSAGVVC